MALRHSFLLLLPFILFSAPLDFRSCQLKYQVSSLPVEETLAFGLDGEYALFYSEEAPSVEIVKRDPFLGLNLIRSATAFKHPFKFYTNEPSSLAAVLPTEVVEGKLRSQQIGLSRLAQFSKALKNNAIISGVCCGILGLSTDKGIIEKEYIRHFLRSEKVVYSDIGIRLADQQGVRVIEVNPFFEDSPFLLDDVIVSMDGIKALSAAEISRNILFAPVQSTHTFVVLRGKKKLDMTATFKQRMSGGLIPDSFFDLFGLELDENLIVKADNAKYEIKKGDRLLYVMGKEVKTLKDIRHLLSQEKTSDNKMIVLLFKRSGFDFFIHFSKPNNSK